MDFFDESVFTFRINIEKGGSATRFAFISLLIVLVEFLLRCYIIIGKRLSECKWIGRDKSHSLVDNSSIGKPLLRRFYDTICQLTKICSNAICHEEVWPVFWLVITYGLLLLINQLLDKYPDSFNIPGVFDLPSLFVLLFTCGYTYYCTGCFAVQYQKSK